MENNQITKSSHFLNYVFTHGVLLVVTATGNLQPYKSDYKSNIRKWQLLKQNIAFVSEHSETLVELDIEYKELADKNGCKNYTRVPALGTNENYIKAMSELIIKKEEYSFNNKLYPPKVRCPNNFKKCPCLNYE